ncbi:MAG: pilin [Candidatus Doudnabacteria bacterium]|nr:pilin [Candidatus Doudnabacteria bacterium]
MISKLRTLIPVLLLAPYMVFASAQDIISPNDNPGGFLPNLIFRRSPTVGGAIIGILTAALGLAGLIAVAMLIYGGFRYITSAGNEEMAKAGKKTITNALIGLVIIILSFVIINVVTNLAFGTTG